MIIIVTILMKNMLMNGNKRAKEYNTTTIDNQKADVVITNHYFLWGVGQKNEVNGNSICGGRPSKIVVEQRWYQALFQWFTFGIYSPMNTSFYCR